MEMARHRYQSKVAAMASTKEAAQRLKAARSAAVRKRFLEADRRSRALRSPTIPEPSDG